MAYIVEIPKPKCRDCSKKATHEVKNRFNASNGFFCRRCGEREVQRLKEMGA